MHIAPCCRAGDQGITRSIASLLVIVIIAAGVVGGLLFLVTLLVSSSLLLVRALLGVVELLPLGAENLADIAWK